MKNATKRVIVAQLRENGERRDNGERAPMRREGNRTVSVNYQPIYRDSHYKELEEEDYEMDDNIVPFSDMNGHDKLDRETAEEWASHMENEDGTKGPHWSYDQTKQVMLQKDFACDPAEFYLAMNMMYSDYCKMAKKMNISTVDFYAGMAKAFLDDKDGGKDKLTRYFRYVVK